MGWCCGALPATLFDGACEELRTCSPKVGSLRRTSNGTRSPAAMPTTPGSGNSLRPGLLRLLRRSCLMESKIPLCQDAAPTCPGEHVQRDALGDAGPSFMPASECIPDSGSDHLVILNRADVADLQGLAVPVAVLVQGARQEPFVSDSAHQQESSFYKSDRHSAAGLQVIAFNGAVESLLPVTSQQEYLLHLREQLFLHPRLGLVVEDAFSRLLNGESGCARFLTPPSQQQHSPFSTLHFLTCLYKASEWQPAVCCAVLLYGASEKGSPAAAVASALKPGSSHIADQAMLMWEISPHIYTIYDMAGSVLQQNNASISFLGNQTSFVSSVPWESDKTDALRSLYHLSPEKYKEMMAATQATTAPVGEKPKQWRADVAVPPADFLHHPSQTKFNAMRSLSAQALQALEEVNSELCRTPVDSPAQMLVKPTGKAPAANIVDVKEPGLAATLWASQSASPPSMSVPTKPLMIHSRTLPAGDGYDPSSVAHSPASVYLAPAGHEISPSASETARARRLPLRAAVSRDSFMVTKPASLQPTADASWPQGSTTLALHKGLLRTRLAFDPGARAGETSPPEALTHSFPPLASPLPTPTSYASTSLGPGQPSALSVEIRAYSHSSGGANRDVYANILTLAAKASPVSPPPVWRGSRLLPRPASSPTLAAVFAAGMSGEALSGEAFPQGHPRLKELSIPNSDNDFLGARMDSGGPLTHHAGKGWRPRMTVSLPHVMALLSRLRDSLVRSRWVPYGMVDSPLVGCSGDNVLDNVLDTERLTHNTSACSEASVTGECASPAVAHHQITAACVQDSVTGAMQIVLIHVDITEQVQRERELQELVFAEEKLLESVFPRHVIEELTQRAITSRPNRRDRLMATSHEKVTILFADLVGFTTMSEMMTPEEVMLLLNRLYTALDDLLDVFGVYKVETIGDCYVVAGGLMLKDQDNFQAVRRASLGVCPDNATNTMNFAKAILVEAAKLTHPRTHEPLRLRVGMHSGPVMSGVVGTRMPRFCLFGDTINTASRMESTSHPGSIHISAATHALLKDSNEWRPTGGVQVKGKGLMNTYVWVPPKIAIGT
ncbi:MAG: hypothetical protein WDW36_009981 [Sanguina aurantia]